MFVIPSSIVVTITDDTGAYLTRTRRILSRDTDLDKVDKLNALCRQICEQTPEYREIMARLQEIEQGPVYSMPMQYFGFGMISAFFTLFYGGVLVDAAAAFVLGVLLKVVIHQLEKLEAWVQLQETPEYGAAYDDYRARLTSFQSRFLSGAEQAALLGEDGKW